jgi:hypothetical protein
MRVCVPLLPAADVACVRVCVRSAETSEVLCEALNALAGLVASARRAAYCDLHAGAAELCEGARVRAVRRGAAAAARAAAHTAPPPPRPRAFVFAFSHGRRVRALCF